MSPLEKGYGTTLGNAIRRVLLSSLDGSAVTAVRIEGVTHEFTTVPGVVEDVIDVMLNLNGLVVKTFSNDPQYLHMDIDRAGAVTGRDIMCPADATIINPDWQLLTLAEGGRIRAPKLLSSVVAVMYRPIRTVTTNKPSTYCRSTLCLCLFVK